MPFNDQESCARGPTAPPSAELKATAIRKLNDQLRADFISGIVVLTVGVRQLATATLAEVLVAVRDFDGFDTDNDPHDEHDFGAVEVNGHRVFWKIDYYDKRLQAGSADPSSPNATTRVLTIMLATEY